jgi:hypothetical protein
MLCVHGACKPARIATARSCTRHLPPTHSQPLGLSSVYSAASLPPLNLFPSTLVTHSRVGPHMPARELEDGSLDAESWGQRRARSWAAAWRTREELVGVRRRRFAHRLLPRLPDVAQCRMASQGPIVLLALKGLCILLPAPL